MATRMKMIEYAANVNTATLAAATKRTLTGSTSIYITESSLSFQSCVLEMVVATDGATAATLTVPVLNFNLGSNAETGVTLANPAANSGEAQAWQFAMDVTSYFTLRWTGNNMTWTASFTGTGAATICHSARLLITYQYEESTSPTQMKTIRIPIESTLTTISASYQAWGGGAAMPPLKGTYLPENGVTVRQVFVDVQAQETTNGNSNFTGTFRINSGTTYTWWSYTGGNLNSARWARSFNDVTAFNSTGSTNYHMEAISGLATTFALQSGIITCTYEYNSTGSTTIYNSLIIGGVDAAAWMGGTTLASQDSWDRNIYIEEPDPITIKESGLAMYFNDSGGFTLNVLVTGSTSGQTAHSAYVVTAGALQCGQYSAMHRIDAGGKNGKGLYLTRGKNLYRLLSYSNTASAGWGLGGYLIFNYTSGVHPDGVGAHAKTCFKLIKMSQFAGTLQVNLTTTIASPIPESDYYLIAYVPMFAWTAGAPTGGVSQGLSIQSEILTAENGIGGWNSIFTSYARQDNENANNTSYGAARTYYDRWVNDPDPDRVNSEVARRFRYDMMPVGYGYSGYYYTYNAITYTVSGTCTDDYSIPQSGTTIYYYRIDGTSIELIQTGVTSANGTFSYKWIDDTDTIYALGKYNNSNTLVGRSRDIIPLQDTLDMSMRDPNASGNFNIVLAKPATGRRIFIIS